MEQGDEKKETTSPKKTVNFGTNPNPVKNKMPSKSSGAVTDDSKIKSSSSFSIGGGWC